MAEKQNTGENIFSVLRRAFSTDVIIRNTGDKKQLTVIDPGHIQTVGAIQTNSLIDRFHKVYTTSTAYGVNLNLAQNYQSARVQIYADYDAMDTDAIISSALDIISDECTLENDGGRILSITSPEENIQNELENLLRKSIQFGWDDESLSKEEISGKYGFNSTGNHGDNVELYVESVMSKL
jgi:hypothetical protein